MTFPGGGMARISLALILIGAGFAMYAILVQEPPGSGPDVINMELDYAFEPSRTRDSWSALPRTSSWGA
jgi:hypothetical protein